LTSSILKSTVDVLTSKSSNDVGDVAGLKLALAEVPDGLISLAVTSPDRLAETASLKYGFAEERGLRVPGWRDAVQQLRSHSGTSIWTFAFTAAGGQFLVALSSRLDELIAVLEVRTDSGTRSDGREVLPS